MTKLISTSRTLAFTTVTGSNGVTSLVGTSGIDVATIVTLASNVFVGAQAANDTITVALATGGNVVTGYTVNGGAGDDAITFNSSLLGSTVNGDGGAGTAGNDILTFNQIVINSAVATGSGNDIIVGVGFNGSTVNGNAGVDTITVGASAASFIYGGQDTDTITITGNSSSILVNGNKGSDDITVNGGITFASSSIYGGGGNDVIRAQAVLPGATTPGAFLSGDLGDDTVFGTGGLDTIEGGDGVDQLFGNDGSDTINGGAGNDVITGGLKADVLTGGGGTNTFNYTFLLDATVEGSTGFDTITDFVANTDAVTPNGDRLDVAILPPVFIQVFNFNTDIGGSTTLADALTAALGGLGASNVALVTITAGAAGASYAGNYIVVNNATAGYASAQDAVIKVNTLANIGAATFI